MNRRRLLIGSALVAVAGCAALWLGFTQGWHWQGAMDSAALDPLYRFGAAHPAWVTGWDVYCTVVNPVMIRILSVFVIVWAFVRRRHRLAVFLVGSVVLSGLVTELAKAAADRPRPSGALVAAHSTSFPSGHALGLMAIVLAVLTIVWPSVRPRLHISLAVFGGLIVLTIGAARVVLNVHHPSDVLAGWALGYAWFVLCLLLVPPRVRAADETPAAPGSER
ncbi:phosphatase PAP2 family protein [Mycobacterium sp. CPCC 205372]|uniref:Phosphatase PAP2 family protein n=1 Tax=Mycobacterium hippophais TaxID=3016340 RepID=A0ABT4PTZ6_9MYCO|nr:phosphatase PAP2 family protein [Mycobacterium hippophais]MCZ8380057.1 phosphatase PAP2 family protein [Mycobacterium hippophais]